MLLAGDIEDMKAKRFLVRLKTRALESKDLEILDFVLGSWRNKTRDRECFDVVDDNYQIKMFWRGWWQLSRSKWSLTRSVAGGFKSDVRSKYPRSLYHVWLSSLARKSWNQSQCFFHIDHECLLFSPAAEVSSLLRTKHSWTLRVCDGLERHETKENEFFAWRWQQYQLGILLPKRASQALWSQDLKNIFDFMKQQSSSFVLFLSRALDLAMLYEIGLFWRMSQLPSQWSRE